MTNLVCPETGEPMYRGIAMAQFIGGRSVGVQEKVLVAAVKVAPVGRPVAL